MIKSKTNS